MQSHKKNPSQISFYNTFEEQLDHSHGLYKLTHAIRWNVFEEAFSKHYSKGMGRPAKSIRLMTGLLILKYLRNLSDESVVEQWAENAYFQYFCGESSFCSRKPCVDKDLVYFRNRIGEEGIELILKESIHVNGKDSNDDHLSVDTTVQEKNITFPTDDKQYKKIIKKCQGIADREQIELRQSYTRTLKKLSWRQRFRKSKNGAKQARKADRKVKTIAGRLVRELERKLSAHALGFYSEQLNLFRKVLAQKRKDKDKTYSLHEPHVSCISKGKAHKPYEFGNKVSILTAQRTGVIVGAMSFQGNPYDGHTLPDALNQYEKLNNKQARTVTADRGYRGPKEIGNTAVNIADAPNKATKTPTQRKRLRRRSAIEPTIGHLKSDYRMRRNFLSGIKGDAINVMLAAAAFNFKRAMLKVLKDVRFIFIRFLAIFSSPGGSSMRFFANAA